MNTDTGVITEMEALEVFRDADLLSVQSFDDAFALIEAAGQTVTEIDKVLGTGFGVADEKTSFVGVPFIVMRCDRHESPLGEAKRFWSMHIVTRDNRKAIINDGGTGIAAQFDALSENNKDMFFDRITATEKRMVSLKSPLLVKRGLRVSNFTHPEHGPLSIYYLDTSGLA